MIGKDKCKMLKEIRREIARENDIQMVIEDCTYQGRCKGTCPKCEAEVAYLEEQLEKRKNLGKAVCVAGISAAMFTTTLQASNVQAHGKTQTTYSQGFTSDTEDPYEGRYAGAMVMTEAPESTPTMPEGTMAPTSKEPTMPPTEIPMPEGTMAPIVTPTETVEVTSSVKPKATRTAFISKIENNRIYIKNGNDNLATLVNDFYLQLTEDAQITKMVDGTEQVITIDQLQPDDKIEFVFSGLIVPTSPDGFLEACEKVTVLEYVTPTEPALPMETPTMGVITVPPSSPTAVPPEITAVPTPTDEYLVYTQSPVPQNTETPGTSTNAPGTATNVPESTVTPGNTVTPGTGTNAPGNTATPGTATNAPENTITPGTVTNIPENPVEKKKCVVTYYDENRETIFEIQEIEPGATLQNMPTPVREGYLFDGWYVMGQEIKASADTKVSGDMSIVAHWKKVTVNETNLRNVKSLADGTLYIKWGKVKNAEGYKVVLASNSKLSKGRKSVTVGSKKTSVKLKGLRDGKKYYVAVYAYKKDSEKNKIYGTCKKNKSVTIKVK